MAFNKDFSTYFLTQPEEEDFQVSYTGNEDGFTCSHCNTSYEKDLQLAAELGKTLLERNKELETSLKQHQNVLEDQAQEIEYLTKQTTALREVNDSRLRIYEQLEVSIQDLERNNQRLLFDHTNDKKTIKTQLATIESLENRCDELQLTVNELSVELEKEKRRQQTLQSAGNRKPSVSQQSQDEEVCMLLKELQEMKAQRTRDLRKITDLEDNIANVIQENATLEQRLTAVAEREQDLKHMQEELSTLEDIRQGHLCRRCLRIADDNRSLLGDDDEDCASLIESLMSEADHRYILEQLQQSLASTNEDNPYRILVQKYEELVRAQRKIQNPSGEGVGGSGGQPLSLQEELEMSGIGTQTSTNSGPNSGSLGYHDSGPLSLQGSNGPLSLQDELDLSQRKKTPVSQKTSRDFCESDTSSSGFSDDISTKSTQTELKYLPGAFLCTISDGEDCRFSIYDDASPVESRFRKTPEYRTLFREIFDVLKRAAEAKDDGEKLPLLLDDTITEDSGAPKVPPGTPAKEDLPLLRLITDSQSVISEEPSEYDAMSNADTNDVASNADTSLDYLQIEEDSTLRETVNDDTILGESTGSICNDQADRESIISVDSDINSSTLKRNKRSRSRRNRNRNNKRELNNENSNPAVVSETSSPNQRILEEKTPTQETMPRPIGGEELRTTVETGPSPPADPAPAVIKPRIDIFQDLIEGVKSRKKTSKHKARLLEERRDTPSPPALVGINNVFVSNKLLRRTRRCMADSPSRTPDRGVSATRTAVVDLERTSSYSSQAGGASSAAQEVAKLKILEKSYAEVLKNNSRHHHNQKHRTAYHRKYN
uniref:Cerebellar degeneration-related protein 2-like n=1 Tax=Cacopsylla melanoneura TaxID=428564 RepID=A0A8D8YHE7_9HEMI